MTEVKICLHAIYSNVAFSMLIRIEGARVNVDVRIKLLNGNVVASCLKKLTN